MEFFWPIVILVGILIIAFNASTFAETTNLRSKEAENVDEISQLRSQVSAKRDKVQAIRLGEYKPSAIEIEKFSQKHQNDLSADDTKSLHCFYCDEAIDREAMVCRHCARPVFANTHKFKEQLNLKKRQI